MTDEETIFYVALLRELQNIMRHTLDADVDVWTEDGNGHVILLKDHIEDIKQEYVEQRELARQLRSLERAKSGKQPAVKR